MGRINDKLKRCSSDPLQGPGVAVPPPFLYATAFLSGMALNYFWPWPLFPDPLAQFTGTAMLIASILIIAPVLLRFRRHQTTLDVRKPVSALITDGPYAYSRNPVYVSLTLCYLGAGSIVNQGWILLLTPPLLLVMHYWVVCAEERHLQAKFGVYYSNYKKKVRRWF
ncbi:isoprenylcysteine carboxylmethyltransferase family protein [Candidatus Methylospira mobilis]|uniref:methyltransferase family protein n=1 Tax=Candidatus Methylospira mobilis TaxID=1808979 RepID=UPI0028E86F68|nr:isoprenylcysteine carboxylmethyltransferase family protein [Candidatus Methylospira mobilis]WNV03609.1 isoprenylcysteine carboxylmethyltransferase family protein [Candidatus Methylospira mobilis]